jgi:hypothetical protein
VPATPLPASVYATPENSDSGQQPRHPARSIGDIVRTDAGAAERALEAGQFDVAERNARAGIDISQTNAVANIPDAMSSLFQTLGIVHAVRHHYAQSEQDFGNAIAWIERDGTAKAPQKGYLELLLGRAQLLGCHFDAARASVDRVVQMESI